MSIARLRMKGDLSGHPFRGNQWSGGGGDNRTIDRLDSENLRESLNKSAEKVAETSGDPSVAAAIESYTRGKDAAGEPIHRKLNTALRSGSAPDAECGKVRDALDKLTSEEFEEPVTVYRGTGDHGREMLAAAERLMREGGEARDDGFGSASADPMVARGFAGWDESRETRIVVQIEARRGAYVGKVSAYDEGEHEVLLPRGSRFRVKGIDHNVQIGGVKVKHTVIRMEQVE